MKKSFLFIILFYLNTSKILKSLQKENIKPERKLEMVQTGLDRVNERALNLKIRIDRLQNTVKGLLNSADDQTKGVMVFIEKAIQHEKQLLKLKVSINTDKQLKKILEELKTKALEKELEERNKKNDIDLKKKNLKSSPPKKKDEVVGPKNQFKVVPQKNKKPDWKYSTKINPLKNNSK